MSKISLIVSSDKLDKIYPAVNLASASAAMNWRTDLFFTFWGLNVLKKDFHSQSVSSDYVQYEKPLLNSIKSGSMPGWKELLKKAKEGGNMKVYACSTTMDTFGITKNDLDDFVDEVAGAATFLSKAKDSEITLFIS